MENLVDSFGRVHKYLRISVTDRCNLRCVYCMPEAGIDWKERSEILTFEEIFRIAKLFVELGVNKVRITGGEPMIRKGIEDLVSRLSSLKELKTLAMTTNGIFLNQKAHALKLAGLNALNVSLDTLQKERFKLITRRDYLDDVLLGINSAIFAGFSPLKINVVVIHGMNDDEILDFVNFVKDKPINIRFIEFMPFKGNSWDYNKFVPYEKIKNLIQSCYELIPINTEVSAVGKDFCIEGFQGTISFITSMTENFCGSCNRVRLTADGIFKTCLFYPGEVSLRDAIRSGATDNVIKEMIMSTTVLKKRGHEPIDKLPQLENQSMIQIGG